MFRRINYYDKCDGNDCLKDEFLCILACMLKILLGNKYEVPIESKLFTNLGLDAPSDQC